MTDPTRGASVGQTVGGNYSTVVIRQQADADLEIGDLLACGGGVTTILQVYDIENGSQLSDRTKEMLAGTVLGDGPGGAQSYEPETSNYVLALAKQLATLSADGHNKPKRLIESFTQVRRATPEDLSFMEGAAPGRICLGQVRSGSTGMPGDGFWMDAAKALSHHMLVVGSTGRGKSNFVKCVLWGLLGSGGVGMLVLDARGEYHSGLSAHPDARDSLACYTSPRSPAPGAIPMRVSVRSVLPAHLSGVVELPEAEEQMMYGLRDAHGDLWIERLMEDARNGDHDMGAAPTRAALCHEVRYALGLDPDDAVFSADGSVGQGTIQDIVDRLNAGRVVVVDTSGMNESEARAIGNILVDAVLRGRRLAKRDGRLDGLPPVGIVIEDAQRLLADAGNAYYKIILEGRKLQVGLVAVSQLASAIPRGVRVNLNTKVIFGSEMSKERDAIVDSAAQDLSGDYHAMKSLDVGEAIMSGALVPFAVPLKIPSFDSLVRNGRAAGRPERPG